MARTAVKKETAKRIYCVKQGNDEARLVSAANRSQARNYVARDTITVTIPSQSELMELAVAGVQVEEAGEQEE